MRAEGRLSLRLPAPSRFLTLSFFFSELLARPSYGLLISITHFALKQRKEMVARIPIFIDYYFFELS